MRTGVAPGQVHVFSVDEQQLALDVASGSLHWVDGLAGEVIAHYPRGRSAVMSQLGDRWGGEAVNRAYAEVEALVQDGLLFSPEPEVPAPREPGPVRALCINLAHDCDLACGYCFAQQGDFGGQRQMMTPETARAAIAWLVGQATTPSLALDFFGGEPLLNLETMQAAVDCARRWEASSGLRFQFTVTTNGTRLDPGVRAFLDAQRFSVVLSVDGRPAVHDRWRRTRDGRGSYDQVIDPMLQLVRGRDPQTYYARGTYTHENLDFAEDVRHLVDLGFLSISLEPVVANPACPWALTPEDVALCRQEYARLAQFYLERHAQGRPFTFFHFALDLRRGPCLAKRLRGCGAGSEYLAVTPDGSFYPCHQLVGVEQFRLGDVHTGLGGRAVRRRFADTHARNKARCATCWARYHCGGGCHANAYHFNGDISQPHELSCQLQQLRLECALYVQARLSAGV